MTGMLSALAGVSLLVGGIRHHEHHARLRHRTYPRDRHPAGHRRPGARHPLAVPGPKPRFCPHSAASLASFWGLGLAGAASMALAIPFAPSVAVIALAVGFSALIGMVFWLLPGASRREARSDRRAAARMMQLTCAPRSVSINKGSLLRRRQRHAGPSESASHGPSRPPLLALTRYPPRQSIGRTPTTR